MTTNHSGTQNCGTGLTALALILILAGVMLLLENFGIVWVDHVWDLWPVTLIAVGLAELFHWSRQSES
ncbi:MAG TPA: DUF5668 domain-containing protein [Bryobacteraceae bacterium]|nr:DUF5668 domain-containing protein [Bryobacteraceae bacterium]